MIIYAKIFHAISFAHNKIDSFCNHLAVIIHILVLGLHPLLLLNELSTNPHRNLHIYKHKKIGNTDFLRHYDTLKKYTPHRKKYNEIIFTFTNT